MLRLNAFLLVGGLAAFVAGSAAGFKVLTVSDNKAQHSPAIITSAEAAPRPAPVTPPRAEEPEFTAAGLYEGGKVHGSSPAPAACRPDPHRRGKIGAVRCRRADPRSGGFIQEGPTRQIR